jgi:hypothetical protein
MTSLRTVWRGYQAGAHKNHAAGGLTASKWHAHEYMLSMGAAANHTSCHTAHTSLTLSNLECAAIFLCSASHREMQSVFSLVASVASTLTSWISPGSSAKKRQRSWSNEEEEEEEDIHGAPRGPSAVGGRPRLGSAAPAAAPTPSDKRRR